MGWKGSDTRSVYFEDIESFKKALLGNPSKGLNNFFKPLQVVELQ